MRCPCFFKFASFNNSAPWLTAPETPSARTRGMLGSKLPTGYASISERFAQLSSVDVSCGVVRGGASRIPAKPIPGPLILSGCATWRVVPARRQDASSQRRPRCTSLPFCIVCGFPCCPPHTTPPSRSRTISDTKEQVCLLSRSRTRTKAHLTRLDTPTPRPIAGSSCS